MIFCELNIDYLIGAVAIAAASFCLMRGAGITLAFAEPAANEAQSMRPMAKWRQALRSAAKRPDGEASSSGRRSLLS